MMIQQILPPQKLLLLHIRSTSEKNFSGQYRLFQDIPQGKFGAVDAKKKRVCCFQHTLMLCKISPTDFRGIYPVRSAPAVRQ